jgi:hypothetical protein
MPSGDRTGPPGQGPRTGGRRGRCSGADGSANGAGYGRRGFGSHCYLFRGMPGKDASSEETVLNRKITALEGTVSAIKKRLGSLSKAAQ